MSEELSYTHRHAFKGYNTVSQELLADAFYLKREDPGFKRACAEEYNTSDIDSEDDNEGEEVVEEVDDK
jgi:hypothetical protein